MLPRTAPSIRRTAGTHAWGSSCTHGMRAVRSGRAAAAQKVVPNRYGMQTSQS